MEAGFWREKWRAGQLGWHQPDTHPMLARHLPRLGLAAGARVFAPLCGKTLDIRWLLANGFRVVGVELVESAVAELFRELGAQPAVNPSGPLKRYSGEGIDVLVGDVFALDAGALGQVEAVYDRAALVALPADARRRYAAHIAKIAPGAPQLLIAFDYDQSLMNGPPFSTQESEIRSLYGRSYRIDQLESAAVDGGLKGVCPAMEVAWLLRPAHLTGGATPGLN